MEIDLEILDMLISDAVTEDFWSATPGEDYNGTGTDEGAWSLQHSMEQDTNGIKLYWVKSKRFLTKSKD